jgi:hypothetical protein
MHKTDDPTVPPPHLLLALRTHGRNRRRARPRVRTPKERLFSPGGLYEAAKRAREEQHRTLYLIDEPTPWHPLKVWRKHLRELRKLDQSSRQVKEAMARAGETIRWIEAQERRRRDG